MTLLKFLGGCREVGRNGVLLSTNSERILMDYGIKILDTAEGEVEKPPATPIKPNLNLDAVLLAHAHLDHSGFLPSLYHRGYFGPLYSTSLSFDLAQLLLRDSIKLAKLKSHPQHFFRKDLQKMENNSKRVTYGQTFPISNSKVTIYNAGHIPGSSSFYIDTGRKKILYSGDINLIDTQLLKGIKPNYPEVDILITESTYSDRNHPKREEQEKRLVSRVRETLERNGIALIPAFAVGRSQEILLILKKYGIDYPLYLDGMGKEAYKIFLRYPEFFRNFDRLKQTYHEIKTVNSNKQRNEIIKNPSVIVTTSGMLNGGPIVHYLKKLHKSRESSITMTGFQQEGTAGRKLLSTGKFVTNSKKLKVNCSYEKLDFSSHLGRKELFDYVKKVDPEKVFCIHGDQPEKFARELQEQGFDAEAPKNGEEFKL